jgi:hypothetical protein
MSSAFTVDNSADLSWPKDPRRNAGAPRILTVVPFAVVTLMSAWIWLGLVWHYHVPAVTLSDRVIESAGSSPADVVFDRLGKLHATTPPWKSESEVVPLANALVAGQVVNLRGQQVSLRMALSPADANSVPLGAMLSLATMEPAQLMVRAYQLSGKDEYLVWARDIILAFDSWERHAWMPVGLAWNDHAVAARVQVLTDFWGVYRHSDIYEPQDARGILELVARCGRRLSDDRYFNVSTNHGVMQNISLLELAIAFPEFPEAARYREIAVRRLNTQMEFYVSDEGVILEHSAYYQHFGLRLLTVAGRMIQMLNVTPSESWQTKYQLAQDFYEELQRPDGSLPQFGDTYSVPESFSFAADPGGSSATAAQVVPIQPARSFALYPVSGYSISWSGLEHWPEPSALSQTVMTWSNFPSRSHKHADDLSVLVWAGGQSWWTNDGYWPYGDPGRAEAESWNGSNAPHLADESAATAPGRLVASAASGSLRFVDVERSAPGSIVLRRQVIEIQPAQWIVLDSSSGGGRKQVVTSWNTAANMSVRGEDNNCYRLVSPTVTSTMETCIAAGTPMQAEWLHGSMHPFAGWQVVDESPVPANALLVEQSTGSWFVNSFRLLNDGVQGAAAPAVHWHDPERWTIDLGSGDEVTRDGNTVRWRGPKNSDVSLALSAPDADVASRIQTIRDNYFKAIKHYPMFDDSIATRRKLTLLLLFGIVASVAGLVVLRRFWSKVYWHAVVFAAILWIGAAVALLVHFRPVFYM